jgi:hypothetical protein
LGDIADLDRAIERQEISVALTPDGHPDKPIRLNNLGDSSRSRFASLGELADLDRAIERQEMTVALTPDGHADKPLYLNNLGASLRSRFHRLGELADLDRGTYGTSLTGHVRASRWGYSRV